MCYNLSAHLSRATLSTEIAGEQGERRDSASLYLANCTFKSKKVVEKMVRNSNKEDHPDDDLLKFLLLIFTILFIFLRIHKRDQALRTNFPLEIFAKNRQHTDGAPAFGFFHGKPAETDIAEEYGNAHGIPRGRFSQRVRAIIRLANRTAK